MVVAITTLVPGQSHHHLHVVQRLQEPGEHLLAATGTTPATSAKVRMPAKASSQVGGVCDA